MTNPSKAERGARRFLLAAPVGGACYAILLAVIWLSPDTSSPQSEFLIQLLLFPVVIGFAGSLIILFFHRKSDEYTHHLWLKGVSAALLVSIGLGLFGSGIEFVVDRFIHEINKTPTSEYWTIVVAAPATIFFFFGAILFSNLGKFKEAPLNDRSFLAGLAKAVRNLFSKESSYKRERNARLFLLATYLGLTCFVFVIASIILTGGDNRVWALWFARLIQVCWLTFVASLFVVFLLRKSDEYTHMLWHTAVSIAFITITLTSVFGGTIEYYTKRFILLVPPSQITVNAKYFAFYSIVPVLLGAIAVAHIRSNWRSE